jgi:heparan-alpha-glucosaminide N-acetyltransferase
MKLLSLVSFYFLVLTSPRVKSSGITRPVACGARLSLDQAEVKYDSNNYTDIDLYAVNSQCYECSHSLVSQSDAFACASLWTPYKWNFKLVNSTSNIVIASHDYQLGEHGRYLVKVDDYLSISVNEIEAPIDSNKPLWVLVGILIAVVIASYILPHLYTKVINESDSQGKKDIKTDDLLPSLSDPLLSEDDKKSPEASAMKAKKASQSVSSRLRSLDTFRGFSLYFMIFVNYGGGGYYFFEHADWNGLTFADLLFPWFMWMMGVSLALSFASLDKKFAKKSSDEEGPLSLRSHQLMLTYKAVKRSAIFFALNLFLNNGYEFKYWRIPGVLFYFAVSYLVTALVVILMKPWTIRELVHIIALFVFVIVSIYKTLY